MAKYRPTELKLLNVLGDGLPHTRKELIECCSVSNLKKSVDVHLSHLRKQLIAELEGEEGGDWLNVIRPPGTTQVSFQLVRIQPATIKDVKSLATPVYEDSKEVVA